MSKDKIHIDQLFKKLKGYQHPVEGGFGEVNDKLHDAAWSDKFNTYEHPVSDIPDFGALALPVSDKGFKPKAARYGLLLLLLALISFGGYYGFKKMKDSGQTAQNNETSLIDETQNKVSDTKESNRLSAETDKEKKGQNNSKSAASNKDSKKSNQKKNTRGTPEQWSSKITDFSNSNFKPVSSYIGKTKKGIKTGKIADKNEAEGIEEADGQGELEPTKFSNPPLSSNSGLNPNNNNNNNPLVELASNSIPFHINLVKRSISELPLANISALQSFSKKLDKGKLPPSRVTYYAQLGLGALSANNPFSYSTAKSGLTFQGHLGASHKRFSVYTGFERSDFSYETNLRKLQIYDSFPVIGPGPTPDTVGWFKKNFRDTTINQMNSSQVIINTIPIHFQFKALQIRKFNLQLGTGFNLNILKIKSLWMNDQNGILVNNASLNNANLNNISKINLGLSLLGRVGFNINPLTEIYTRINIREGSNILGGNNSSLKPGGMQLDFGIKYHLK